MQFTLHIDKVDPDYRWNRVQALDGEAIVRFVSFRDDATLAWVSASTQRGGGVRIAPALGSAITAPEHWSRVAESPLLEIRQYRIAPGQRDRFARFFVEKALPALQRWGIAVYGQFDDLDDENNFVWLRGFPIHRERDRRKAEFYQSKLWLEELQDEAFSMIEDYSNSLLVGPV